MRGVPLFSPEATRLMARGPRWRDPPEPPPVDDELYELDRVRQHLELFADAASTPSLSDQTRTEDR